jgi:hypothetical protein
MVRSVLSFLALLPLLLPPGLCICHAATAGCAAGTAVDGGDHDLLAHFGLAHSCHADEHGGPCPPKGSQDHVPGCPLLKGQGTWYVRPGNAGLAAGAGLVGLLPVAGAPELSRLPARVPARDFGFPDQPPPLYLSLCNLRI